ncbi:glycosyltransferase family 4 protein [Planococcus citreus]|uniref:glycosyltransferase family 4 protein n=1 Tax=Planococcus citreus TaxID=1373 RepID=UPI0010802F64|nr:glycosyltransferase family 4 protein [Planococcus citreus]
MKTIWILDHHASEPKYGGITRHYDFAKELAKRGKRVVVIASSYSHFSKKNIFDEDYKIVEISENAHFVYLRTTPEYTENSPKRFLNMASFVRMVRKYRDNIAKALGEPDSVMGCSVHPLTWIAAYNCAKKYKVKFFIEVRDFWPDFFIQAGTFSRYHPIVIFFSMLEKWAYKNADKIIVSLPFAERYICDKLGFSKEKVVWIGQPMDCKRFDEYSVSKVKLIPEEITNFINDSFVCTFTGYYKSYEGVLTMLKAAKILQDKSIPVKFVFVGNGSEKEEMSDYVRDNQLFNVYVGSRINKEAIPTLLRKSQIKLGALSLNNKDAFAYGISKNKINEYLYSGGMYNIRIFSLKQRSRPFKGRVCYRT